MGNELNLNGVKEFEPHDDNIYYYQKKKKKNVTLHCILQLSWTKISIRFFFFGAEKPWWRWQMDRWMNEWMALKHWHLFPMSMVIHHHSSASVFYPFMVLYAINILGLYRSSIHVLVIILQFVIRSKPNLFLLDVS